MGEPKRASGGVVSAKHQQKVQFIWGLAELLRGDYKRHEYGDVILPLVVLRRLDCVLESTKPEVLKRYEEIKGRLDNVAPVLQQVSGHRFYNLSPLSFERLLDDPSNLADNLRGYIRAFSPNARDIIEKFSFDVEIDRLDDADLLYQLIGEFAGIDLHPEAVSNLEMGYMFEELIRRFAEQSNETAGEHFTPREVIRLMVNILFAPDTDALTEEGAIRTLYDPACGTGGMLSVAEERMRELNEHAHFEPFGQELNPESYAICRADMLIKGQDASHIVLGNSFSDDGFPNGEFDYMLTNPPFGVDWKKVRKPVEDEHENLGFDGRFGAGTPRISDGQLLFLQHMLSKMQPTGDEGRGSRLAIVFNGSPLFSGGANSGESNIRRWIIENDWLEAIVGLPEELFYNTGISTYIWVLTNRKPPEREGKVQLIDARDLYVKMRKSLGNKRNEISDSQIDEITCIYDGLVDSDRSIMLDNDEFGYQRVVVERPKRVRFEGGPAAVERLKAHDDWADERAVRKSSMDEADEIRTEVIDTLAAMPSEGMSLQDATAKLESLDAWKPLLKKAREAVLDAVFVEDPDGEPLVDADGEVIADTDKRDYENVPLTEDIDEYMEREVLPHVPDAWVDKDRTEVGYEIPFTRHFYSYEPPRPLEEIDADIREVEQEILELLGEVTS